MGWRLGDDIKVTITECAILIVTTLQSNDDSKHQNMNKNTVKINLKKLVELNLLEKHSVGKGTWYKRI